MDNGYVGDKDGPATEPQQTLFAYAVVGNLDGTREHQLAVNFTGLTYESFTRLAGEVLAGIEHAIEGACAENRQPAQAALLFERVKEHARQLRRGEPPIHGG